MTRLRRFLDLFLQAVLTILVSAMIAMVLVQVFGRYVLKDAPPWTEELARWVFVWICFLGASLAHVRRAHIRIELLPARLPPRVRVLLSIAIQALSAVFLFVVVKEGWVLVTINTATLSPAVGVPMAYVFAAVPINCGLMLVLQLVDLAETIHGLIRGNVVQAGPETVEVSAT